VKKKLSLFIAAICLSAGVEAQEAPAMSNDSLTKEITSLKKEVSTMKKLVIGGWIQAQFQYVETRGAANFDGGNFAPNSDKRFMIRRGRIKFTYNGTNTQYVMQLNGTERGLNLTEIYAVANDPWAKTFSLTAGIMNRPFGFEIDQSSAVRESPERSRYTQILMPNERDLGARLSYSPKKESPLNGLRIDAGMFNGQGVYVPGTAAPAGYPAGTTPVLGVNEFDFQKDFIGRLSFYRNLKNENIRIGIGTSHYNGGNMYQNNKVYNSIATNSAGVTDWVMADTTNKVFKNKTAPRVYYGFEAFLSVKSNMGTTTIRGEYITGTQSGSAGSTSSPFYLVATAADTYVRNFDGMYAYFIHRIGKSKHEVLVKYEWYDPNTKITGKDILPGTKFTAADIKYTQLGIGYNYYMYDNVKFMFYYNIITNESAGDSVTPLTGSLLGLDKDIRDNILTVRMTYRF
jgi:hypothetical protein